MDSPDIKWRILVNNLCCVVVSPDKLGSSVAWDGTQRFCINLWLHKLPQVAGVGVSRLKEERGSFKIFIQYPVNADFSKGFIDNIFISKL